MLILLVDDDPEIRDIAGVALERVGGHAVLTAPTAEEGLALARSHPIDLLVLDSMMPDRDGAEVLEQMKSDAELKDIPVVMLTARSRPTDHELFTSLGARGVLTKPFDPMTLSDELTRLVEPS